GYPLTSIDDSTDYSVEIPGVTLAGAYDLVVSTPDGRSSKVRVTIELSDLKLSTEVAYALIGQDLNVQVSNRLSGDNFVFTLLKDGVEYPVTATSKGYGAYTLRMPTGSEAGSYTLKVSTAERSATAPIELWAEKKLLDASLSPSTVAAERYTRVKVGSLYNGEALSFDLLKDGQVVESSLEGDQFDSDTYWVLIPSGTADGDYTLRVSTQVREANLPLTVSADAANLSLTAKSTTVDAGASLDVTVGGLGRAEQATLRLLKDGVVVRNALRVTVAADGAVGHYNVATSSTLAPGTYTLQATSEDNRTADLSITITEPLAISASPSSIPVGKATSITVSGLLGTDTSGTSTSDTTLKFSLQRNGEEVAGALTSERASDGTYTVTVDPSVTPGTYSLVATQGSRTASTSLTLTQSPSLRIETNPVTVGTSTAVNLENFTDITNLSFTLLRFGQANSEVVDGIAQVQQDGNRRFLISIAEDLAPGFYTLRAQSGELYVASASLTVQEKTVPLTMSVSPEIVRAGIPFTATVGGLSDGQSPTFQLYSGTTMLESALSAVREEDGTYTVSIPATYAAGVYTLRVQEGSRNLSKLLGVQAAYKELGLSLNADSVVAGNSIVAVPAHLSDETPSFSLLRDGTVVAGAITNVAEDDGTYALTLAGSLSSGSYTVKMDTRTRSASADLVVQARPTEPLRILPSSDHTRPGRTVDAVVTGTDFVVDPIFILKNDDNQRTLEYTASQTEQGKYTLSIPTDTPDGTYQLQVSYGTRGAATKLEVSSQLDPLGLRLNQGAVTLGDTLTATVSGLESETPAFSLVQGEKSYSLTATQGNGDSYTLTIGEDLNPGTYQLTVTAGQRTADATVTLRAKSQLSATDAGGNGAVTATTGGAVELALSNTAPGSTVSFSLIKAYGSTVPLTAQKNLAGNYVFALPADLEPGTYKVQVTDGTQTIQVDVTVNAAETKDQNQDQNQDQQEDQQQGKTQNPADQGVTNAGSSSFNIWFFILSILAVLGIAGAAAMQQGLIP
ncbi:MAG: hypothetical protein Q3972_07995, partial [Corynebacterium sp.]|nr:hypothetical protein [Corynebacterium sp.]